MAENYTDGTPVNAAFLRKWIPAVLLSLCIIALLGALMRYKMGFTFPYLDQKNLQHAHSHFAFAGWVTQSLMLLMIYCIRGTLTTQAQQRFSIILAVNLLLAWGMLTAFAIQGYKTVSIIFSTGSLITYIWFAGFYVMQLKTAGKFAARPWFIAAFLFGILSLLGTLKLTVMIATKNIPQHDYLASVYWYLHFQYNGWFFFACMGVLVQFLHSRYGLRMPGGVFWLLSGSCIPACGLSVLWAHPPLWVFVIIVLAAAAQLAGWIWFLQRMLAARKCGGPAMQLLPFLLLLFVLVAGTVKFLLQAGSVHPEMSKLAFGFRPIVIAYLHLALLAFISMFIVFHFINLRFIRPHAGVKAGVYMLLSGIFINEAVLAIQGAASFSYTVIRNADYYLFGASLWIFTGAVVLFVSGLIKKRQE